MENLFNRPRILFKRETIDLNRRPLKIVFKQTRFPDFLTLEKAERNLEKRGAKLKKEQLNIQIDKATPTIKHQPFQLKKRIIWILFGLALIGTLLLIAMPIGIDYGIERYFITHGAYQTDMEDVDFLTAIDGWLFIDIFFGLFIGAIADGQVETELL